MSILVVGAGLSGVTVARKLAEAGYKVKVIDSRNHIAGNAYDYINEFGIRIHQYGPHIFHTNSTKVFNWLSNFTDWVEYKHKVKAQLADGQYVTFPVNQETKRIVGKDNIIDTFFRPYTKKMWDMSIEELNPNIINRIPIRNDNNEYYFPDDEYQFMPTEGYTRMVHNILAHPNICLSLNTSYANHMNKEHEHIFNSMAIDQYFDYKYGKLPYRSIRFETIHLPMTQILPTTTVNFTHHGSRTRVTEWKHFPLHGENKHWTTLTFEEPCDYKDNNFERYYPINDKQRKNRKLYEKYKNEKVSNMTFIGRCGLYVYLDMDQAISSSLAIVRKFLS